MRSAAGSNDVSAAMGTFQRLISGVDTVATNLRPAALAAMDWNSSTPRLT